MPERIRRIPRRVLERDDFECHVCHAVVTKGANLTALYHVDYYAYLLARMMTKCQRCTDELTEEIRVWKQERTLPEQEQSLEDFVREVEEFIRTIWNQRNPSPEGAE